MPQPGCALCVNLQLVYSRALRQQAEAIHEQVNDFHKGDKELQHKLEQTVKEAEKAAELAKQSLAHHDLTAHGKGATH